jgi:hypothetical protein
MKQKMSSDNSSVQHVMWAKSGAEQPHFLFTGKFGINVDLQDPRNSQKYCPLFCTPEIVKQIGMAKIVYKTCLI